MLEGRLRSVARLATIVAATMLAVIFVWTATAESRPKDKPAPEGRTTNIQLLGVNDFHGNLQPPRQVNGRTVGGAAYLDAYLDKYESANPKRTIRVHAGDMGRGLAAHLQLLP